MDTRRLLLAGLLSLAVLMAWQTIFPPPVPVEPAPVEDITSLTPADGTVPASGAGASDASLESVAASGETGGGPSEPAAESSPELLASEPPLPAITGEPGQRVTLETERWTARFDSTGARLVSMELLTRKDAAGEHVELVRQRDDGAAFPFSLVDDQGVPLALDRAHYAVEADGDRVAFSYRGPEGTARKEFRIDEDGLLTYAIQVEEPSSWAVWFGPGVANPSWDDLTDRLGKSSRQASVMKGELSSRQTSKLEEAEFTEGAGTAWFSLENKYFLMAVAPKEQVRGVTLVPVRTLGDEDSGPSGWELASQNVQGDGPVDAGLLVQPSGAGMSGSSYWGAKEYTRLSALPFDFEKTVRFGFFSFLARPLLYGLRWIHASVVPNWGWSIVLMTVAINLLLFPLRHKSFVSMQRMQKLNPRMEAIRNRYRPKLRDKQGRPNLEMQRKMNEEIQGLFKQEGVNPAMGCLPLLLQMPVFFAFYRLLAEAVELQGAPWIGWIADLSLQDPIKALPLLMGATQFLQTKTMPPAANPTQRIIMTTMPIWFTLFAFAFPAGLVLYWLTNNVLTIIQQAGYNRLKKAGYFGGADDAQAPKKQKLPKQAKAKPGS